MAAEVFLRLFAPVPMLPRYVVATDFGIRGNQPATSYRHRTPEYEVLISVNAQGMRSDHEVALAKAPGVKRVLLLGDSFGMGYGVDLEDTFLEQMGARLRKAGHDVELLNLAVSGHGNAEELIMLREKGLAFQPDLVIVAWHDSDLVDNVRSNLFRLRGGALEQVGTEYLPGVKLRELLFSIAPYRWLVQNSQLYTWLREAAAIQVKALLAMVRAEPEADAPAPGAQAGGPRPSERPYAERLSIALVHELARVSREAGAAFVLLDIPVAEGRIAYHSFLPGNEDGWAEGIEVVSPIAAFGRHPGEMLYWERSQGHLTPLGTRETGASLAARILEAGLLRD